MKGEPLTGPANPAWNLGTYASTIQPSIGWSTDTNDRLVAYGQLCVPTLQPGGGPYPGKKCLGLRLVGAPFFHENYVVFNQAEPSISYAPYV